MPARFLTKEQILAWRYEGRSPGKRTQLFNAEWESLCDLAIQALEQQEELEQLRNEIIILRCQIK